MDFRLRERVLALNMDGSRFFIQQFFEILYSNGFRRCWYTADATTVRQITFVKTCMIMIDDRIIYNNVVLILKASMFSLGYNY